MGASKTYGLDIAKCENTLDRLLELDAIFPKDYQLMMSAMLHERGWGKLIPQDKIWLDRLAIAKQTEGYEE